MDRHVIDTYTRIKVLCFVKSISPLAKCFHKVLTESIQDKNKLERCRDGMAKKMQSEGIAHLCIKLGS